MGFELAAITPSNLISITSVSGDVYKIFSFISLCVLDVDRFFTSFRMTAQAAARLEDSAAGRDTRSEPGMTEAGTGHDWSRCQAGQNSALIALKY